MDRKSLIIGTIIATIIASTPYLFYLYEIVPHTPVWDNFIFRYDSTYYGSMKTLVWTLMGKTTPLLLLFIWFFTCRHWWYHTLLVPISMYIYQIFTTINEDTMFIDTNQLFYLLPIMGIIIPSIYLIRAQIFNKVNNANKSLQELEDEFKVTPRKGWDKIKEYF
ncbi:hypothetical protein ACFFU1_06945 [Algibacter miyuki]|uniref:Uncharacterized protein n=1 Tax=Algibacter miyuki TaxID=1306933 RepID=A0ABV5GYC3_9FLAO|nr:hypothetical protein [Algibacter miyuki]MDN3667174.1 hypothetical protein [Algibacter miyuki]